MMIFTKIYSTAKNHIFTNMFENQKIILNKQQIKLNLYCRNILINNYKNEKTY